LFCNASNSIYQKCTSFKGFTSNKKTNWISYKRERKSKEWTWENKLRQ